MSKNIAVRPIEDAMELLRRVHPKQVVFDKNTGQYRPASAAFIDPEMSVDVLDFISADGFDCTWAVRSYPGYSLARFTAGYARSRQQRVEHTPITSDPINPYHADVIGKKTPSEARQMGKDAGWAHLVAPEP